MVLLGAACPIVTNSRRRKDIIVPGLAKMRVNQTLTNGGICTWGQQDPYPLTAFTARLEAFSVLS